LPALLRKLLRSAACPALFVTALSAQAQVLPSPDLSTSPEDEPVLVVNDPFEGFNRAMFRFNDGVFTYALRPLNRGYEFVAPKPVRKGLHNAFDNVKYPVRLVSSLLQGKGRLAAKETGKFAVNTVGGVGGLFRTAERIPTLADLPEEDMGQVFGAWRIPAGPYLVLPIMGPSNPRELLGSVGNFVLTPTNWDTLNVGNREWIGPDYRMPVFVAGFLSDLPTGVHAYEAMTKDAIDPYLAVRNAFVSHRAAEIKK
jgi:phospholipid-binding lipoprotein MlaA